MGVSASKIFVILVFLIFAPAVYAQLPSTTFLNDSATYNGPSNNTLSFRRNITIGMNPVHTVELQSGIGSFEGVGNIDAEIEYRAGNTTGFLLRFTVNDEDDTANDKIQVADCVNSTPSSTICTGSACGGKDFNTFSNITVVFNSTTSNATIHIGTANLSVNVCTNATMVESVRFISNFLGIQGYSVKNNIVTADNRAPIFLGNISNITMEQNAFFAFNISGNFTDPDGENLTFGFSDLEDITIALNQSTGIVNITPLNFIGLRFVRFFANDTKNATFSGNISINVQASQASASAASSSSSSSPSGSGSGGYICRLDWQCSEWADCDSGLQTRKCRLVEVPDTVKLSSCPQLTVPQQARNCTVPADANAAKGTCMDEIKNQNEENIDCGGACIPCQDNTAIDNTSGQNIKSDPISSRKIVKNYGINIWLFLFIAVLGLAIIILSYKIIKKKNSKK